MFTQVDIELCAAQKCIRMQTSIKRNDALRTKKKASMDSLSLVTQLDVRSQILFAQVSNTTSKMAKE